VPAKTPLAYGIVIVSPAINLLTSRVSLLLTLPHHLLPREVEGHLGDGDPIMAEQLLEGWEAAVPCARARPAAGLALQANSLAKAPIPGRVDPNRCREYDATGGERHEGGDVLKPNDALRAYGPHRRHSDHDQQCIDTYSTYHGSSPSLYINNRSCICDPPFTVAGRLPPRGAHWGRSTPLPLWRGKVGMGG
jgi:hypothetical protein